MTYREKLKKQGYVATPLSVNYETRLELAHVGSQLIDLAKSDSKIHRVLNYSAQPNCPGKDVTTLQVGVPRVAKDDSVWLHTGLQNEERARQVFGNNLPEILQRFFMLQRQVVKEVSAGWTAFLKEILDESDDAVEILHHEDSFRNNIILRFVRYPSLDQYTQEKGTFSVHGDLSVLTMQLFNSHEGHLNLMPYPIEKITDTVDKERYNHAKKLRDKANIAAYDPDSEAATFLGFGSANLRDRDGKVTFAGLHAGYHFGVPPIKKFPIEPKSEELFGEKTRMVVVAFAHPHYDTPYTRYRTPTSEACRPEQVWEKNTKQDA